VHTLPLYQRPALVAVKAKLANYGAFGLSDKNFRWEDVGYQK
jgi:peptide/nickel transport system substrate-binding protein